MDSRLEEIEFPGLALGSQLRVLASSSGEACSYFFLRSEDDAGVHFTVRLQTSFEVNQVVQAQVTVDSITENQSQCDIILQDNRHRWLWQGHLVRTYRVKPPVRR